MMRTKECAEKYQLKVLAEKSETLEDKYEGVLALEGPDEVLLEFSKYLVHVEFLAKSWKLTIK